MGTFFTYFKNSDGEVFIPEVLENFVNVFDNVRSVYVVDERDAGFTFDAVVFDSEEKDPVVVNLFREVFCESGFDSGTVFFQPIRLDVDLCNARNDWIPADVRRSVKNIQEGSAVFLEASVKNLPRLLILSENCLIFPQFQKRFQHFSADFNNFNNLSEFLNSFRNFNQFSEFCAMFRKLSAFYEFVEKGLRNISLQDCFRYDMFIEEMKLLMKFFPKYC